MIIDNDPDVPIQLTKGENGVTLVQSTKLVGSKYEKSSHLCKEYKMTLNYRECPMEKPECLMEKSDLLVIVWDNSFDK